jgi:hypothetical protein
MPRPRNSQWSHRLRRARLSVADHLTTATSSGEAVTASPEEAKKSPSMLKNQPVIDPQNEFYFAVQFFTFCLANA